MKVSALVANLLFCMSVQGGEKFDYPEAREWVEKRCATNAIPKAERLFVGYANDSAKPHEFAGIVRFHQGITLREIVDQTPFRKSAVTIQVMHERPRDGEPRFVKVKPSENPDFEVRRLDVLWILEERRAEQADAEKPAMTLQLTCESQWRPPTPGSYVGTDRFTPPGPVAP